VESPAIGTQTGLAKAFDVSLNTVKKWILRAGFPGGAKGPWQYEEVAAYLATTGSPKAPGAKPADAAAAEKQTSVVQITATAKALIAREQARKLKLANDEREGLLVAKDEVEQEMALRVLRIKERLEALPDELLMELPARSRHQLKARIEHKIRLILAEMARWGEEEKK